MRAFTVILVPPSHRGGKTRKPLPLARVLLPLTNIVIRPVQDSECAGQDILLLVVVRNILDDPVDKMVDGREKLLAVDDIAPLVRRPWRLCTDAPNLTCQRLRSVVGATWEDEARPEDIEYLIAAGVIVDGQRWINVDTIAGFLHVGAVLEKMLYWKL